VGLGPEDDFPAVCRLADERRQAGFFTGQEGSTDSGVQKYVVRLQALLCSLGVKPLAYPALVFAPCWPAEVPRLAWKPGVERAPGCSQGGGVPGESCVTELKTRDGTVALRPQQGCGAAAAGHCRGEGGHFEAALDKVDVGVNVGGRISTVWGSQAYLDGDG